MSLFNSRNETKGAYLDYGKSPAIIGFLQLFVLCGSHQSSAAETEEDFFRLEEVVVTARKREEGLQDAPLAISAYSGDALSIRGVSSIERLADFTPNLVLQKSPTNAGVTNASVYIRGIGHNDFSPGVDPGIGIYVDGVYLGRSVGGVLDTLDIQRIEVLRGPQGTLFGRNTIGGAISVVTQQPDEVFAGNLNMHVGTDQRMNIRGALNIPITDTFFTRVSMATLQQDGYVDRPFDNKDLGNDNTLITRISALWAPSDALEVSFSGDYSRDRENGPPQVVTEIDTSNPFSMPSLHNTFFSDTGTFNPLTCFDAANTSNVSCYNNQWIDSDNDTNFGTGASYANLDVWGTSLTVDWDMSDTLHMRSISAYRNSDGEFSVDRDGSPLPITHVVDRFNQEQVTQEVQFLGEAFDSKLEWIFGLYYFHEEGADINPIEFSAVSLISGIDFESDSFAAFGQGTYAISDALSLTLGLRYTKDDKTYVADQVITATPLSAFGITFPCLIPDTHGCEIGDRVVPLTPKEINVEEVVSMVNLAYNLNEDLMAYVTYSEGFKSGGVTQRIFPPEPDLPSFEPEFVTSYEAGLKFDGWGGRLRLNVAAFYTDYEELQLLVSGPPRIGAFIENAGEAEIWGVELELTLAPGDGWLINASAGYTDPEFTELAVNPDGSPRVPGVTRDSRFEHISEWTTNVQLRKEIFLAEWGSLTPRLEWSYRSDYFTNDNNFNVPQLHQDDYQLVNISTRWDVKDTGVSVTGGIDNVSDEKFSSTGSFQAGFAHFTQIFDRGREWYLKVNYSF